MENKDMKPFYIYSDKNNLYIKNINEQTEKLASNIFAYGANITDNKNIHICGLDTKGRIIHFFNNKYWRKKTVTKAFNSVKNVKDIRLYIINDLLNIFVIEKYPITDNLNKISHFSFDPSNYKVSRYTINNVYNVEGSIYKLNRDELSNILFEYKTSNPKTRGVSENTLLFNSVSRKWLNLSYIPVDHNKLNSKSSSIKSNIKDDIFEYCYSINYRL